MKLYDVKSFPSPRRVRMFLREKGIENMEYVPVKVLGGEARGGGFLAHTHTGGEELLVLDGTFSNGYGDFPAGTYVRNPVGSAHAPSTRDGCTILVKLWWMHEGDQEFVRLHTGDNGLWRGTHMPGVETMALHAFKGETTALYRLDPGAGLGVRDLPGGEEFFVLEGEVRDPAGTYGEGAWVRTPVGLAPDLVSAGASRLLVKRSHLLDPPPGP